MVSWPTRFPGFPLAGDRGALNILDGLSGDSTEELLSNSAVLPISLETWDSGK